MNKKKEPNSEYRGNRNFLCCPCFGKRTSSSNFSIVGLSDQNEPFEYIVEKLAIKKVPLSLFATSEDLQKQSKIISDTSTPSYVSQKSQRPVPATFPLTEKQSTFSAYYQFTPKPDLQRASHTVVPEHECQTPSITSLHYQEPPPQVVCSAFLPRLKSKKTLSEDQEREMVSHILNKHSSLFTLDAKEAIPKDPDHLPTTKTVVPPCVQEALKNPNVEQFPPIHGRRHQQVQIVEVHRGCEPSAPLLLPPMKYPSNIPGTKKELTPELKQTINALGFAQRPHIPGMPPKNQRSIVEGTICEGVMEKELCGGTFVGDHVTEKSTSIEMACHHSVPAKEKHLVCKPMKKKVTTPVRNRSPTCVRSDYEDSSESLNSKTQGNNLVLPQFGRNLMVEQYSTVQNNKLVSTAPDSCNPIQIFPPLESVGTSEPKLQESEQITEISQLKGQSLKWKIIIKHHSDKKDKEDKVPPEISDFSESSDSESKPYLLSNRSLSTSPR